MKSCDDPEKEKAVENIVGKCRKGSLIKVGIV